MPSLKPVTLITGASAGIGAALADEFADHGHDARAGRAPRAAAQGRWPTRSSSAATRGRRSLAVDLARPTPAAGSPTMLREAGCEPQFVVNNAGFGLLGPAAELDRAEQLAMIDLNVRVLTELSLRFVDSLARHRGGILNVASVAGFMPGPGMAVYHATKAYVLSFSEALHRELAPQRRARHGALPRPGARPNSRRAPEFRKGYFPRFLDALGRSGSRATATTV